MPSAIEQLTDWMPFASADEPGAGARYLLLDVFAERPLEGNPLAVFPDARKIDERRMQAIARELNLSETVFLLPAAGGGSVRARIFTPSVELPFAGHPVLGSAVVVARATGAARVTLETGAGAVPVEVEARDPTSSFARMRQPIPTWHEYDAAEQLLAALGLSRSLLPVEVYCNGPHHVYVQAPDLDTVSRLEPDSNALLGLGAVGFSCFAGEGCAWRTRMFAPGLGVVEDPATGSAAGPLAVHLARHGRIEFGQEIEITQGVELGRPSRLLARAAGSASKLESVEVAGSAVLVAEGRFAVAVVAG